MIVKSQCIVLRCADYRDYDRMLTLYSLEYGKINAAAYSCKRPKSKIMACSQPLCYGDYAFNKKGERLSISQCEIIESFYGLRTNLDALAKASYFLSVVSEFATEQEPNAEIFSLVLYALYNFCYGQTDPSIILAGCSIKLLRIAGFCPNTHECAACGNEFAGDIFWDSKRAEFVCGTCAKNGKKVSKSALEAINRVIDMELKIVKNIRVEDWLLKEIMEIISESIEFHTDKKIKAGSHLSFYAGN